MPYQKEANFVEKMESNNYLNSIGLSQFLNKLKSLFATKNDLDNLNIKGEKGDPGESAGFGTPTATVDTNVGTPSVTITATGSNTEKIFNFAFKNLKGEKGDKGDNATTTATATNTSNGLMSSSDKAKLDTINTNATANSPSTTTPKIAGTASVGTETNFARGDHVHPAQTTVSGNAGSATKLATGRTIDGVSFDGSGAIVHYGSCSTAAATAAKVVACTGFTLVSGATIRVKFTITNTATNPTLNVNGTGAKPIYYRGAAITAGYLAANRTYEFVYNGTQYEFVGDINVDTNTDTKNTAGSTASTSKLFLVGATSQAANPQTYSRSTAYIGTDGCLYSNNTRVISEVTQSTEPTTQKTGDYWFQEYT